MSTRVKYWLSNIKVDKTVAQTFMRYHLHNVIWQAFKYVQNVKYQPFLFSINNDSGGIVHCFVQSKCKPQWCNAEDAGLSVVGMKKVEFDMIENTIFKFRLCASPVKNFKQLNGSRGKKQPMTHLDDVDRWIQRRASDNGFVLCENNFDATVVKVRKKEQKGVVIFNLASCHFNGILVVVDPKKMANALMCGVGSKKAFGFGQLLLASVVPRNKGANSW